MPFHTRVLFLLVPLLMSLSSSFATPKLVRQSHGWRSYSYEAPPERVCYQIKKSGSFQFILTNRIIRRKQEWSHNVVTLISQMNFKPQSKIHLIIDQAPQKPNIKKIGMQYGTQTFEFDLLADQNTAWATTERIDNDIRNALANGLTLEVSGELENNTPFKAQFSLIGFQKAVNIIDALCPYLSGSKNPIISNTAPSKLGSKRLPEILK